VTGRRAIDRHHGRGIRAADTTQSTKEDSMKLQLALTFVAGLTCATAAHAQTCSGGADGGMDATGNQCNQPSRAPVPEHVLTTKAAVGARAFPDLSGAHEAAALRAAGATRTTPKSARLVSAATVTRSSATDRTVRH
jgi:hypothetical protein